MSGGTGNKIRIWHPARDAYHCAFRLLRLLTASKGKKPEFEHLRILDLFLLAPSQLYRISMPRSLRERFNQLAVPKEDDVFVRLPSINAMFQELRIYQNTAAGYLVARDIVSPSLLRAGIAEFNPGNVPSALRQDVDTRNKAEKELVHFLMGDLWSIPLTGADNIYKRAGLPARHLLS